MGIEQIDITEVAKQGPWALLFVWLLWNTKKESKERENRLMAVLEAFSEKYDLIIDKLGTLEEKINKKGE